MYAYLFLDSGVEIIRNALRVPITQIVKNTGIDPTKVVEKVVNSADQNDGYDALTGKHCNMIDSGIVDPTKVCNATKEASLCLHDKTVDRGGAEIRVLSLELHIPI